MSLEFTIPKTAIYIQTLSQFTANFNTPTGGKYDFNNAGNVNKKVLDLLSGSLYLITRVTVGGNISQEQYLGNIINVPMAKIQYQSEAQTVYPYPIPIVQFSDGLEAVSWFYSDRAGESLSMSLDTGLLNQDTSLIGVASVTLNISLTVFQITDGGYIQNWKGSNQQATIGARTTNTAPQKFFVGIDR